MNVIGPNNLESPGKTVLVVDDEAGVREILGMILEAAGYRCLCAADGADGLQMFRAHRAEIGGIVTDMNMPLVSGFDFIRGVREVDPEMKIVLCSGSLGEGERRIAGDLQVCGFIPKPFSAVQLINSVRAAVGGAN